MLSDVSALWDNSNSTMVTGSAQSQLSAAKLKIERLPSINCFNQVGIVPKPDRLPFTWPHIRMLFYWQQQTLK